MAPTDRLERMTENTAAARLLKCMCLDGTLTGDEKPFEVRALNETFKLYDVKSFGNKFRDYKDKYAKGKIFYD